VCGFYLLHRDTLGFEFGRAVNTGWHDLVRGADIAAPGAR
jgi:hypothetical protein